MVISLLRQVSIIDVILYLYSILDITLINPIFLLYYNICICNLGGPMGAANLAAAAAFAASGGVPPHMITPELQRLQKQQMELQRLHMASMNHSAAGSFGHQSFDAKVSIFISQGF